MKIRTKLIGLLSGLLLLVILASTLGGWLLLRSRVETTVLEDAEATARDIASSMEDYLETERSDDEIGEKLELLRRRHPLVVKLALQVATEEGETVQLVLPVGGEVEVSRPQRQRRGRSERALAFEVRRALIDHGESLRPPAQRGVEPLWRLSNRGPSSRWGRAMPVSVREKRSRDLRTREGPADECRPQRCLTLATQVDPLGTQRGTLEVTVLRDRYTQVLRDQLRISFITTPAALLLLLLATAYTVNRVVARPVSHLEQAMHAVEQGDLRRRVTATRTDEVGNLGRGFNAMLDRLAQADEEIRGLNARLADDIAAATRDMKRKNEALDQLNQLLVQVQRELGDKERLAALGQLAAQLAHELGTPLASVSGHLQLAAHQRDVPPHLRERLQVAIGELGRVSKIIRDYLDSTRPAQPALIDTDPRRVIEEAIRVAGSSPRRKVLRILTEIDPGVGALRTDPGLLRQILINLLTNAMDATCSQMAESDAGAPPGRVHVVLRRGSTEHTVELAVKDEGAGIPSEDLARIFEPFYTTKGRGRGTGLGLSICRELARALGGQIRVVSEKGRGSEFAVVLPQETPPPMSAERK